MHRILAVFLAVPLMSLFLSMPADASPSGRAATSKALPTRTAAVPDAQIDSTIRAKLAKSKIGKDGFKYHVAHGVVTWEGNTNVIQHKGSATRMAHSAGATGVVNNIQISSAAKAKAAANLKKATVQ